MTKSVRIVEKFGVIEDEAQSWNILDVSNIPMHQYAWVKACTTAFAYEGRPQLIVIGADQPGAIGPLFVRSGRLNRMESLGVHELNLATSRTRTPNLWPL